MPFTINAAGQLYKQTTEFLNLGGAVTADSKYRGVFSGPGRAYSGKIWKSMIARVCAYG